MRILLLIVGLAPVAYGQSWTYLPAGPIAYSHSAAFDPATNRMIVCFQSTVWVLHNPTDPASAAWSRLSTDGPAGNCSNTSAYDPATNQLLIYNSNESKFYLLTNANGSGRPAWRTVATGGQRPPPRWDSISAYDPETNRFVIHGGVRPGTLTTNRSWLSDVWVLSHANGLGGEPQWTEVRPTGTAPRARAGHCGAYAPRTNRLIFVGGEDDSLPFDDVWTLNDPFNKVGATSWTKLSVDPPFVSKTNCFAAYDSGKDWFITVDGMNRSGIGSGVWVLTGALQGTLPPRWEYFGPDLNLSAPGPRGFYDPVRQRLVLHGGYDEGPYQTAGIFHVVPPASPIHKETVLAAQGPFDAPAVTVDGRTVALPVSFQWPVGSPHRIVAAPALPSSDTSCDGRPCAIRRFERWGNSASFFGETYFQPTHRSYMGAVYENYYRYRVVAKPPEGGSVSLSPAAEYVRDVTLTITTNPGFRLAGDPGEPDDSGPVRTRSFRVGAAGVSEVKFEPCSYALSRPAAEVGNAAAEINLNIETRSGCIWSVTGMPWWAELSGPYTGSGRRVLQIRANPEGTPRSANLVFAGQPFLLRQGFVDCAPRPETDHVTVAGFGDMGSLRVVTYPGCKAKPLRANSNSPWLAIRDVPSRAGLDAIYYRVDPNPGAAARTGSLTIGNTSVVFRQAGAGCTFTWSAGTPTVPAAGGEYSLNLTASAPNCTWQATSPDWIQLTPASGTGSSSLLYRVLPNASATLVRAAPITVGGSWFHVIQHSGTVQQPFADVPATYPFAPHLQAARAANVAVPPAPFSSYFYAESSAARADFAELIVRAFYPDGSFTFSDVPYFEDVPAGHLRFAYIQKLRELGITAGCRANHFCPDYLVTRGEAAAFLMRARLGVVPGESIPFSSVPAFSDVPATNAFFPYVQKMAQLGITNGCAPGLYCVTFPYSEGGLPGGLMYRWQAAVFLVRAMLSP